MKKNNTGITQAYHYFHRQQNLIMAITFLMLLTNGAAFAQLEIGPIPHTPPPASRKNTNAKTQEQVAISLPFWDDFSAIEARTHSAPDTNLWLNSTSVLISDGSGINAPSINVAVFNGLDSLGSPYSVDASENGFGDKMISCPIKMSEVATNQRNTVYLSFFYEWSGNGEPPDNNDFLRVDFLNNEGKWVSVETIYGSEDYDPAIFYFRAIPIADASFYHDEFRFRIMSYGRRSGSFDTWLLDYFFLDKGRSSSLRWNSFPDRAIASRPVTLFEGYRAMPYAHFKLNPKLDTARFGVHNVQNTTASTTYNATASFLNYKGGATTSYSKQLVSGDGVITPNETAMTPFMSVTTAMGELPDGTDPQQFDPDADSVDVSLKVSLVPDPTPSNGAIDSTTLFPPINFLVNDTASATYQLRKYYAYDDGIAEYSAGLTQTGNKLAYRFDMLIDTATLYGFDVYFPYLGGTSTQTLDITVYSNDNGTPSTPLFTISNKTITKTTQNQFTRIIFIPPVFIQDTTFYIGWTEPSASRIKVGLDKSNDTNSKIYAYAGNGWFNTTDVHGSLMIRPFFDKGTGVYTGTPEQPEEPAIAIHPNPSEGVFYITDKISQLYISDITGRITSWKLEEGDDSNKVTLNAPAPGLYIVRWVNSKGLHTEKVLIRK